MLRAPCSWPPGCVRPNGRRIAVVFVRGVGGAIRHALALAYEGGYASAFGYVFLVWTVCQVGSPGSEEVSRHELTKKGLEWVCLARLQTYGDYCQRISIGKHEVIRQNSP